MTEKKKDDLIMLNNVRATFPHYFVAKAVNEGDKPAFSGSFIMPKDHPDVAKLKEVLQRVAQAKWGDEASQILSGLVAGDKVCLHNGDAKSELEGYAGNLFVSSRSLARPLVLDADKSVLTEADGRPYSGCYVNVQLAIWAQQNKYGKRINAQLRGVQFFKDGEAFSGGGAANPDAFAAVDSSADDAPPAVGDEFGLM
jgi:hypothetical protein